MVDPIRKYISRDWENKQKIKRLATVKKGNSRSDKRQLDFGYIRLLLKDMHNGYAINFGSCLFIAAVLKERGLIEIK